MTKRLVAAVVAAIALFASGAAAQEQPAPGGAHDVPASQAKAPHADPAHPVAPHADGENAHAPGEAHAAGDKSHGAGAHDAGPVPPPDKSPVWAGVVLILILAMFVMAAVIGPVARAHAPPMEMPPTHSHDEPPGASHHHGASGTINPEPGHGHGHGHH